MFWKLAIKKNREALTQIVAGLFVLVGWNAGKDQQGDTPSPHGRFDKPITLGPISFRRLAKALRTIEAALRRLIVLYSNTENLTPSSDATAQRPLPDFAAFNEKALGRAPTFNLFDPRKPLTFFDENELAADHAGRNCEPEADTIAMPSAKRSAALLQRLIAVDRALKTLPQQTKRLVAVLERRKSAPPGPGKVPPIRPGIPPGFRQRGAQEEDRVLRECHGLLRDWQSSPP